MSRCFPFPPPGYEKKARTDDADVLTKEKHKEKRQKKDKRDKEKKDKERSKEKHREKKDRKEKHKDKKDKDRDKERKRTSDAKKTEGQPEVYNGEKPAQNSQEAEATKDSKFVQELGRRIRDERGSGSQMVEKCTGTDQRRAERMDRVVEKDIGNRAEAKENNMEKGGAVRRADGQRNRDEERGMGNALVPNFTGIDQRRVEGMTKPMEKDAEKRMEGKDKESDDKRGNKHKDGDRDKKTKGNDKDKNKEREKEKEKMKEKRDHKNKEQVKLRESDKDHLSTLNVKPSHLPKDSNKSAASKGNLGKRKDVEMNGIFPDNDIQPSKLPRPTSSSHPFKENGRKLEPCQTAIPFASDRQGAANNHKVDGKQHKINGIIEAQQSSIFPTKPSFAILQANENGEAFTKPPHPDSKYLSRILSVPKMEEWSDFDDQDWLFSSDNLQSKKPKTGFSVVAKTPLHVWAEALQIESADVSALPYVIPY